MGSLWNRKTLMTYAIQKFDLMAFEFLPNLRLWILNRSDCETVFISSILEQLSACSYDESVVFIVLLLFCSQLAYGEAWYHNCIH